jgi:hypothetical protein
MEQVSFHHKQSLPELIGDDSLAEIYGFQRCVIRMIVDQVILIVHFVSTDNEEGNLFLIP